MFQAQHLTVLERDMAEVEVGMIVFFLTFRISGYVLGCAHHLNYQAYLLFVNHTTNLLTG